VIERGASNMASNPYQRL